MITVRDLVGQRFGRLVVLERAGSTPARDATWRCKCDCGSVMVVLAKSLRNGDTKSCGCLAIESVRARFTKHGMAKHPLKRVFGDMLRRCYDQAFEEYKNYGGRGISICDEWLGDRARFFDWALANGWAKGLSIDRIDNNGNYEPSNCRFATPKQQANNRRTNTIIDIDGEKLFGLRLKEFVDGFGIVSYRTFVHRVRHGVPPRIAASTPVKTGRKQPIGAT